MDKKDHWMTNFINDVVDEKVCQKKERVEAAKQYDEKIASTSDPVVKDALETKKEQILAGKTEIPVFEKPAEKPAETKEAAKEKTQPEKTEEVKEETKEAKTEKNEKSEEKTEN